MPLIFKVVNPEFRAGLNRLENLFDFLHDVDCFVAGGFARYCILNQSKDATRDFDIDVFFPNIEEYEKVLLKFSKAESRLRFHGVFGTLFDLSEIGKVNFIRPIKFNNIVTGGTIKDVLMHFDFTVCAAAIDKNFHFYAHKYFSNNCSENQLNFICFPEDPTRAFRRILKYVKIGFNCPASTMQQLFLAYPQFIADRCLENINTETKISEWFSERYRHIDFDKYLIHADEAQTANR